MTAKTKPFDAAGYLNTAEARDEFLRDALETGDAGYIAHAETVVAQAEEAQRALELELHRLAAQLGRTVVIEEFGVYLASRSGSDDERIGRTADEAHQSLSRRVLRRQTAAAQRTDRPH